MSYEQEINEDKLKNVLGDVILTDAEKNVFDILTDYFDDEQMDCLTSMIQKARKTEPLKPQKEKRLVYVINVYFIEEVSRWNYQEYIPVEKYEEIETIKKNIIYSNGKDVIDEIEVIEEPEVRLIEIDGDEWKHREYIAPMYDDEIRWSNKKQKWLKVRSHEEERS